MIRTSEPLFTVFTPTFNRALTLERPFDSLRRQTLRDFEWIVVDDGSTDGSEALLERLQREATFSMRVIRQPNRGKHVAMNRAVEAARGRYFAPLDSDDECLPQALERLKALWDDIPSDLQDGFAGVTGRCRAQDGQLVGRPFPKPVLDVSGLELRYRFRVRSELWGFARTEILRRFPFPEKPERTRIPESLVWDRIAKEYRTRFVDEVFRIYHVDAGESLGAPRDPAKGAPGSWEQHRMILNEQLEWLRVDPAAFFGSAAHFVRFSIHLGIGPREQYRSLSHQGSRLLMLAAFPLGVALWLRDKALASR